MFQILEFNVTLNWGGKKDKTILWLAKFGNSVMLTVVASRCCGSVTQYPNLKGRGCVPHVNSALHIDRLNVAHVAVEKKAQMCCVTQATLLKGTLPPKPG